MPEASEKQCDGGEIASTCTLSMCVHCQFGQASDPLSAYCFIGQIIVYFLLAVLLQGLNETIYFKAFFSTL